MHYYQSMQELIGHTPLVELTHFDLPEGVRLFAKLELWNPGGSAKDRVGRAMIADAEAKGLLKPGGTIIEATAGNTGPAEPLSRLRQAIRGWALPMPR